MSGKLDHPAVGKSAKDTSASLKALEEAAGKWSKKFEGLSASQEDEFCEAWIANFEKLRKVHREHVEELKSDDASHDAASKMLCSVVKKTMECQKPVAGVAAVASTSAASASASPSKRKAAKHAPTAAAVSLSPAPSSSDADRSKSPRKARPEAAAPESPKVKKKVKKAKMGDEPLSAMWAKTSLSPSPVLSAASGAVAPQPMTKEDMLNSLKRIVEADGTIVKSNADLWFLNWGSTVRNLPCVTFEPVSRTGVQNIVMWARKHGKRVRACGYRHTWSDMYSETDQVLVSMLPVDIGTSHQVVTHKDIEWNEDDLEGIKIVRVVTENSGKRVAHCKIGASTTNEQFRRWCLRKGKGEANWEWTIPLNVIMVEITYGGSNAPICHGAGLKQQTLSDLVHEIEFVNPKGIIQRVSDPELLRSASGAFGIMGIVTAVTLRLDPMSFAKMKPTKLPVHQSIPPPDGFDIPADLRPSKPIKPEKTAEHVAAFEAHCKSDYYAEWFWFPLQKDTWNNCWHTTDDGSRAKTISEVTAFTQGLLGIIGEAFNETLGRLSAKAQTTLIAYSAMASLPDLKDGPSQVVPLIEALHFRRGIQNMRVVDLELEIPIPDTKDGHADWSICRRAWWDVIQLVYKHEANGKYPLRVALEMRVMGDSNVIMAPQLGNKHGTCSIEVLTTLQTPTEEWNAFMQEVADIWHSYKDANGNPLNVRTHWAKQWQSLVIGPEKKTAIEYYRTVAYKDRIPEFLSGLKAVAHAGGYKLGDMKERFSTPLLDDLFFHQ